MLIVEATRQRRESPTIHDILDRCIVRTLARRVQNLQRRYHDLSPKVDRVETDQDAEANLFFVSKS